MSDNIAAFVLVGFLAQMVDGALGMAYGITATTVLLAQGVSPAAASASVHTAEMFTTAASGASHWRFGNVDTALLLQLAVPGMTGGILGAALLAHVPGDRFRPVVAVYLLAAGLVVLVRGLGGVRQRARPGPARTIACGGIAGFLDAAGGGGWGLIVTSTMVWSGLTPRYAIGTACLTEFFVTTAISLMFFATIGMTMWKVILGLIIGGVIAAPIAAYATRHLPERMMMVAVGLFVIGLSLREIVRSI